MKIFIKGFFVFLLLMLSFSLFSQTRIDSLEARLKTVFNKEKIEVLNELSEEYKDKSSEKRIEYAKLALELSKKYDDKEGKIKALTNISRAYYDLCEYKKAIGYFSKALIANKEINNEKGVANTLNNIGVVYDDLGDYEVALEYYLKSLQIREEINDKYGIAASLNNIGIVYYRLNDYNKVLEYFVQALEIRKDIGDKKGISSALNNIANIYRKMKNYNKALEYCRKSLKIDTEIGYKKGVAGTLNNLGVIYLDLNNYDKALENYLESLKITKEIGNKYSFTNTSINIGNVLIKLQNYKNAYQYFKQSMEIAQEIESKKLIMESYHAFSELYTAKEDYQQALEYYKLYTEEKDSIFTEESSEKIAEMQTKYETEKKEKENEILKKDNDIQKLEINKQQNLRNSFIVISALVLILAFVIYTRYRSKQKTNIILNQKNIEIENANTELNQKNKQITKQKKQLSITLKELRETQKMLTDTAHRAGMAEIATGILHNVGNVLNSVKVSSQILKEKIISSKVNNLQKVLSLMEAHTDDIGEFITSDEKGKMLPEYLLKVGVTLKEEQDNSLKELSTLHNGINHIEEIIAVQQSYAGVSGLVEKIVLSDMMDDVLKMHSEMFRKYKIKITKKYSQTKSILVEKGKLIQVFVNLLKNAKESLEMKDEKNRIITINILENEAYQVIEIVDNGIGIVKKNLGRIFSYGFSTKKDGKGFGLHTSALAMGEMKGKLSAESNGDGKGAKFIISIPIEIVKD